VLWQQKWLRERFAEVSEQLLAHAPPLWGAAFQERLKGPALPALLLPVAWAAVLLGAAALGWWMWKFAGEFVQILRRRTARSARIRRKTDSKR